MRFNKTILVLLLGVYLSQSLVFQVAQAKPVATVKAAGQSESKNEWRRLSMTVPGIGTANITVIAAPVKTAAVGKPLAADRHIVSGLPIGDVRSYNKDLSIESNGNNITVAVPASVDAAIDDAQVLSRQLVKYASIGLAGANRFVDLLVLYFKQWTGSTTVTPGGYPYVEKSTDLHTFQYLSGEYVSGQMYRPAPTTIASGHKLYLTGEGRLKSVVSR